MTLEELAAQLEEQLHACGLSREKGAEAAAWRMAEALRVLEGDPSAPVGALLAICEAAGCDLKLVPRPASASDPRVTEPQVETKVEAAIGKLKRPVVFGVLKGRVPENLVELLGLTPPDVDNDKGSSKRNRLSGSGDVRGVIDAAGDK